MKLSKTKSILVIVVKWWDRGPSTSVARSVFRWQWIWFQCQSKDNKLEHVLSFFRTCSEFHLSGYHYKTSHSPKGTNTDLFHTLLALRSAFFSFVAVVSLLSGVKEENRESLLARAVNTKEPLCTRWCMLLASFTSNHALIEMITSWSYGGTLNQVLCARRPSQTAWGITWPNTETLITKIVKQAIFVAFKVASFLFP